MPYTQDVIDNTIEGKIDIDEILVPLSYMEPGIQESILEKMDEGPLQLIAEHMKIVTVTMKTVDELVTAIVNSLHGY